MAAAIRDQFPGAEVSLQPSSGGRFEVTVDGIAVFEKSKVGRHAQPGEVLELVRLHQATK
ncbi:MAG: SelT/SelW/SelH family protein [Gemmatimonadaceae bacterium]|nr:SelT/SelW/SelH family protein [Gemmatimonadaceae bacterium]